MPPMPVIADNQGFASLQLRIWTREFGILENVKCSKGVIRTQFEIVAVEISTAICNLFNGFVHGFQELTQ